MEWKGISMGYLPKRSLEVREAGTKRKVAKRVEVELNRDGMVEALMDDAGLLEGRSVEEVLEAIADETGAEEERNGRHLWEWGLEFLVDLTEGMKFKEALAKEWLSLLEVNLMRRRSKTFREMYRVAEDLRMATWMPQVLESTIDLAIDGEERKHFDKNGKVVGVSRERSVKAQEILLRALDKRFAEKGAPEGGGTTNKIYNFAVFPSVQLPAPGTRMKEMGLDAVEVEDETKALAAPKPVLELGASIEDKMAALPEDEDE